ELAPRRQRALRLPDPVRIVVDEAEDPRLTVARPARVAELELLEEDGVVPRAGQRVRRRGAHDTGADDGDLGALGHAERCYWCIGAGAPGRWSRFSTSCTPCTLRVFSTRSFSISGSGTSPRSWTTPSCAFTLIWPFGTSASRKISVSTLLVSVASS